MVPGAGIEPARLLRRGILSPLRLPIPPPGLNLDIVTWRLSPELNRGTRFCKPLHNHSATQPMLLLYLYHRLQNAKPRGYRGFHNLERETRFELATSSLATRCSTTELFPQRTHIVASAFEVSIKLPNYSFICGQAANRY